MALAPPGTRTSPGATTAATPAAPSDLTATPDAGGTQINLTWTDNAGNETGFVVERSPNGVDGWNQVGTAPANATSFSDSSGLSEGSTYYYRVHAINALSPSADSNIASAQILNAPTAPGDLAATGVSTTEIDLQWSDNSDNETGFVIERSLNGVDGWTLAGTAVANATSFNDAGLTPGSRYFYRVRATNGGVDSDNTAVAQSWPLAGMPSSPTPNGVLVSAMPTTLDWADVPNATSYDVYWGDSDTFLGNVVVSEFSGVIPASADGAQSWHVVAKNDDNSTTGPQWSFTLDTTAPTATYNDQAPTPLTSTFDFTVTYSDTTAGIDASTFDDNDITVIGPGGPQNAVFISAAGNTVTYRITAPGGTWDVADDGLYTVSLNADEIRDLAGNSDVAGSFGSFNAVSFAYVTGSTLNVAFDGTSEPIALGTNGSSITVTKGATTLSFDGITDINALGSAGTDTLQIDGVIAPAVSLAGSTGNALVHIVSGSATFANDLSPSLANVSVSVDSGALATFNSSQHLAGLTVNGTATFAAGGGSLLRTSNLTINGQLNLNDNAMVLDYNVASPYGDVAGMVQSGRGRHMDGQWHYHGHERCRGIQSAHDTRRRQRIGLRWGSRAGKRRFGTVKRSAPRASWFATPTSAMRTSTA